MEYTGYIKNVIVFSRWSRKNYAIFASLGKIIKIARVSADIADKALIKSALPRSLSRVVLCFKKYLSDLLKELQQCENIPDVLISRMVMLMNSQLRLPSVQAGGNREGYIHLKNLSPCFIFDRAWTFFISRL